MDFQVADQSAHFLMLHYNFHFQGALAVLKQFLESNLVRIVKTVPPKKWLIVDCRNTWATNLPTSVAWWRHTGDGHWLGGESSHFFVSSSSVKWKVNSGKNQEQGLATPMALRNRWHGSAENTRRDLSSPLPTPLLPSGVSIFTFKHINQGPDEEKIRAILDRTGYR